MLDDTPTKRKRGRPLKSMPKIDATQEEIARAMFSAVKPPDPSLRKFNRTKSAQAVAAS